MILPGTGHPTDAATAATPVARTAADVVRLARSARALRDVDGRSSVCRACPRLVAWREEVAQTRRASYADQVYWGRPITGWGPQSARIAVVGLAPAAHGGNRTGRIFTGDRSGDWLFAALHRAGLASSPVSTSAHDGLQLHGTRITLPVRCAPPGNRPTTQERDACAPWLTAEWTFLQPTVRAVVVLGGYGWAALWPVLRSAGERVPAPVPRFAHGAQVDLPAGPTVLGCFHVSQQNTFTGRLTEPMLDDVLARAKAHAGMSGSGGGDAADTVHPSG
ncbi:MAG: Uracil-DNA glycosylase, family 5 [uncultured Frankineae bacterium]|uniref:Type-5 uracil-DNA glycosylase n=1 Tax=uncultured Frankineae bacterium TaxID=437475 RepID=A0A6J4LN02_9ACTN|nr:MAG: Uracil-DNA glycosylase, family 5 [uncultured Frankineae bacterium]